MPTGRQYSAPWTPPPLSSQGGRQANAEAAGQNLLVGFGIGQDRRVDGTIGPADFQLAVDQARRQSGADSVLMRCLRKGESGDCE